MEPYNLRRCELEIATNDSAYFYTCARPGRSLGPDEPVPDSVVSEWVNGLPPGAGKVIISLLGRRKNRRKLSEFFFYSFFGGWDTETERSVKPSFQEWLRAKHGNLDILVREHPTFDYDSPPVRLHVLRSVKEDILSFLSEGRTVIVMDSGGANRTTEVADYMNANTNPVI